MSINEIVRNESIEDKSEIKEYNENKPYRPIYEKVDDYLRSMRCQCACNPGPGPGPYCHSSYTKNRK